ncbi:ribbon-helix-helix protein, CopG family [Aquifex sp.]
MKVRKNITLSKKADEYLKILAKEKKKSQSEVIEELIEKEAKGYEKIKKLEAFERFLKLTQNISISDKY